MLVLKRDPDRHDIVKTGSHNLLSLRNLRDPANRSNDKHSRFRSDHLLTFYTAADARQNRESSLFHHVGSERDDVHPRVLDYRRYAEWFPASSVVLSS